MGACVAVPCDVLYEAVGLNCARASYSPQRMLASMPR